MKFGNTAKDNHEFSNVFNKSELVDTSLPEFMLGVGGMMMIIFHSIGFFYSPILLYNMIYDF